MHWLVTQTQNRLRHGKLFDSSPSFKSCEWPQSRHNFLFSFRMLDESLEDRARGPQKDHSFSNVGRRHRGVALAPLFRAERYEQACQPQSATGVCASSVAERVFLPRVRARRSPTSWQTSSCDSVVTPSVRVARRPLKSTFQGWFGVCTGYGARRPRLGRVSLKKTCYRGNTSSKCKPEKGEHLERSDARRRQC